MFDTAYTLVKDYQIKDVFAVDYNSLEMSEKKMIWYFSIQRANFEVTETRSGLSISEIMGETEGKKDTNDHLFKKVLSMSRVETPSFKQVFAGSCYKIPIIAQMIALNGEIYGITVRSYNTATYTFSGSIFLIPSNPIDVSLFIPAKNLSRKSFSVEDYKKKFKIIGLLETLGYEQLLDKLIKNPNSEKPSINSLTLTRKFNSQVAPLDHFINVTDLYQSAALKSIFVK